MEAQDEDKREIKREAKAAKLPAGIISVQLPPMSSAFDTAGWPVAA
jgi:hypothetical protein